MFRRAFGNKIIEPPGLVLVAKAVREVIDEDDQSLLEDLVGASRKGGE